MSALRSAGLRTLSPHRKALISGIPHHDGPPFAADRLTPHTAASFTTSCHCPAYNSQSAYMRSKSSFRKEVVHVKMGAISGRGRGPQQHSVGKVLTKVQLSNWTKGGLSSVFSGLGAFAASVPNRFAEGVGRLVRPGKKETVESKIKNGENGQSERSSSVPAAEESDSQHYMNSTSADVTGSYVQREQHTFEKSVEDTNQGISSFYHAYTATEYVPASTKKLENVEKPDEELGWNVFRRIPLPFKDSSSKVNKKPLIRKDFVSRTALEARTRALVSSIKSAVSPSSSLVRTQDLCAHLKQFPSGRHDATENKVIPCLVRMRDTGDEELRAAAREALALLGYTEPVRGRGIRLLALDGGGTRGLLTIQCLKTLERMSGKKIFELFDYVSGVSTGALIAAMVCLYRLPLEKCEQLYLDFSRQMFSRSRVMGTGGLVWNHAFYDSDQWEKILQKEIGHRTMIEFSRDPLVPKMSAVSTLMNTPRMKNFVFRNYNLPPSTYSNYPGSCVYQLWEVIRASSAAPGYYEDFALGDYVHSDGGLSVNNPTALAVHESRLLWPNEAIQCVVSVGTGRYEPTQDLTGNLKITLKEKIAKVIDSATNTEAVHVMMNDLMPPDTYFRINPYLSEDLQLDEIRQDKLDIMYMDTSMYLRKNEKKMNSLVNILGQKRMPHQQAVDWFKHKADAYV